MDKMKLKFTCTMRFVHTACAFQANTQSAILKHQKEVHEPESLEINGYDPGYVEPHLIHVQQVLFNPYRVEKRHTEPREFDRYLIGEGY